jgi:hypothetical protein
MCSVKYIADKQKRKDNSHKASLGSSTVEELQFLPYAAKKNKRTITRKTISINNKIHLRKPIKVVNNNNNNNNNNNHNYNNNNNNNNPMNYLYLCIC